MNLCAKQRSLVSRWRDFRTSVSHIDEQTIHHPAYFTATCQNDKRIFTQYVLKMYFVASADKQIVCNKYFATITDLWMLAKITQLHSIMLSLHSCLHMLACEHCCLSRLLSLWSWWFFNKKAVQGAACHSTSEKWTSLHLKEIRCESIHFPVVPGHQSVLIGERKQSLDTTKTEKWSGS